MKKPCPFCKNFIPDSGVWGLPTYTDVPKNHKSGCPIREIMEVRIANNKCETCRHYGLYQAINFGTFTYNHRSEIPCLDCIYPSRMDLKDNYEPISSEPQTWACGECGKKHKDELSATSCCFLVGK